MTGHSDPGDLRPEEEARGLAVSDDARARILTCADAAQLAAWVRKAVTAASVEELF